MHTSLSTFAPETAQTRVIIDCQASVAEHPVERLLQWINSSQSNSGVHVYLRRIHGDRRARSLVKALRSRGCTVTLCSTVIHAGKQNITIPEDFQMSVPLVRSTYESM